MRKISVTSTHDIKTYINRNLRHVCLFPLNSWTSFLLSLPKVVAKIQIFTEFENHFYYFVYHQNI